MESTLLTWTPDAILALAPDPASAKAGRGLAGSSKWRNTGYRDSVAWGECQGSGAEAYRTAVDFQSAAPAYKCSCPSRKIPCKHALGLMLMLGSLEVGTPPEWAQAWLNGRAARAAPRDPARAPDPEARAKRMAARERKVTQGLEDLALWLEDLVRGGLAAAQSRPASSWEERAARLIDAQAPGAARLVRALGEAAVSGEGWQARQLDLLGRLYLLSAGYPRQETLDPALRAALRAAVGWTQDADEVRAVPGLRDRWQVQGVRSEFDENLSVRRTWLRGARGHDALILEFAHPSQPLPPALPLGSAFDAELHFFPGAFPRALRPDPASFEFAPALLGHAEVERALETYAAALARNPWLETLALSLTAAVPVGTAERPLLADLRGQALPLHPLHADFERLRALGGGQPLEVCGEWDGQLFVPLAARAEEGWVPLGRSRA
ncbi:hypothetical protein HNR42_000088 [Deinobacterium chartae]|uniref:SWIM-type domain-containing protein n=1 Tax=Deinobacterium chartae TaxID=521158 RepID=A0A841HUS8_9DEIO|nr:SWIM zinc finger family protein [Deinobacterium chartae]MBB6096676.1 hypothetical protein [Deinobacterium chartae]